MVRKTRKAAAQLGILLADDHELVRRGIRGLLSANRKWRIVGEASDGFEAIEKVKKVKPDIVILDIDMPGLNGLEAAPKIREAAPLAKIVVLTLHESGEMVRRALEAGAHGFVLKSDLAERLVTALEEVSHKGPVLTPKASEMAMHLFLQDGTDKKAADTSQRRPTYRETEVIRLLVDGKANKEVAAVLGISVRTAEVHRANIMKKLGLRSLAELIRYALRNGIAPEGGFRTVENRSGADYVIPTK
ncbi:MAG TPA: response regulator transcription factor [Candidatus Methylomirabilis sp.]|nr:response regulator transcription factor [Candidatus Methylomirabilis sp.]